MEAYNEFTRRIDREVLEIKIHKYAGSRRLDKLCDAIARADFSSRWIRKPYLALYGFHEGRVSVEDTVFILLLHSAGEEAVVKPLDRSITETFRPEITYGKRQDKGYTMLDPDVWLQAMQSESLFQRHYVIGPKTRRHYVSSVIRRQTGINVFRHRGGHLIIASPAMHRVFLREKFGDDAVLPNYCLGRSWIEDLILSLRQDRRDTAIPCPKFKLPSRADTRRAPGPEFSDHDNFHNFLASGIPKKHRQLWLDLGEQLKARAEYFGYPDVGRSLLIATVDLEFEEYRQIIVRTKTGRPHTPAMRFWMTLDGIPDSALLSHPPDFPQERIREAWITLAPMVAKLLRERGPALGIDQASLDAVIDNEPGGFWPLKEIRQWLIQTK